MNEKVVSLSESVSRYEALVAQLTEQVCLLDNILVEARGSDQSETAGFGDTIEPPGKLGKLQALGQQFQTRVDRLGLLVGELITLL